MARGRSGTLYYGHAPDGGRVALKVHERADEGRREIARLAAVDHPGVVALLDHGMTDDGSVWLALPWIEGRTLAHLLADEAPLAVDRVRRLIGDLAAAVDAIHAAGLVHGDLAPSNVLIGDDDRVTLIDLGAARSLGAPGGVDETTGVQIETTPRYAAPEIAGGGAGSAASDVYALGLMAYEAATGRFAYPEVATPIAMLAHHAATEPVPPSEHRPDLPMGVEAAVLDALAKAPTDRFDRASEFAAALHRDTSVRRDRARRRSIGPLRAALVALAVLAVIGAVAVTQLRGGDAAVTASRSVSEITPSTAGDTAAPPVTPAAIEISEVADAGGWSAGRAAGAVCNLVAVPGFELAELPDTYYSGDPTNTTALVPGAGVDATVALRVGSNGAFGIFGEIVPIGDDREFVASAWIRLQGSPGATAFYVDYLDADYEEITAEREAAAAEGRLVGDVDGIRLSLTSVAPPDAMFAVPTFFKDGGGGSLLVDEVIFGPASTCPEWAF